MVVVRITDTWPAPPDGIYYLWSLAHAVVKELGWHFVLACNAPTPPPDLPADLVPFVIGYTSEQLESMYPTFVSGYFNGDLTLLWVKFQFQAARVHRYWLMEYDVRYTGSWRQFFEDSVHLAIHSHNVNYKGRWNRSPYQIGHDTFEGITLQNEQWAWSGCTANWEMDRGEQRSALGVIWGVSPRLLEAFEFYTTLLNRVAYYEIMLPSIAFHEGLKTVHVELPVGSSYVCCDTAWDYIRWMQPTNQSCLPNAIFHKVVPTR
ncbi:hypothetical protein HDU96_009538 [Phlyctochytrium bullatum]|nr:hypothetical protein HDU96_009538 [Phlyctochytrium bullatum]